MEKIYVDIVRYECPMCDKDEDVLVYLQGENVVSVTIRYICLSMYCTCKWTIKYLKPKGGKNESL